jgi:hypothetical protein
MNLMFWKKKAGAVEGAESPQDDAASAVKNGSADSEATKKPGLFAKISSLFTALIRHFKKPPAFNAEENQATDSTEHPESDQDNSTPSAVPPTLNRRLIIAGIIGLLILSLSGIGFAVWKFFLPPPQEEANIPAKPAPQTEAARAKIEALKKKNEELQAQIEALKKEQPQQEATESQQPVEPTAKQPKENALSSSDSGDLMIDNKDPKATAMSLKEAIEAMNEGYGDYGKKRGK